MRASVFRPLGLRREAIVNVFKRHQINIKPNLDGSRSWETPSFKLTQLGCNNECQEGAKLNLDYTAMLAAALAEARKGRAEGGIPIGAAIFDAQGKLLGAGHNRRVQQGDPSMHGETDAFRNAGRQRSYRNLIMVTTLAPCWYCSGLVRQFGFGTVLVGESRNFQGGVEWLRSLGVTVIDLDSEECATMLGEYIRANPEVWNEDIGEE
jgi:creatinine deaminase